MLNQNNNNTPQWVTFTATADFWGDSGSSQMSFRKNARIEVDVTQNHNNGWRWGKSGNRTGWFPEWAAEERSLSRSNHLKKGRSRDRIQPMLEKISETDQRSRSTKSGYDRRSRSTKNSIDLDRRNRSNKSGEERLSTRVGRRRSTGMEGLTWKDKLNIMAAARSSSKDEDDEDEKEEVLQIETVELKSDSSSCRSERSYKNPEAVNRLAVITGFSSLKGKNYSGRSSRSIRSISTGSLSVSSFNNSFNSSISSNSNATFGSPPQQKQTKKLFGKFPKISRRRSSHTNLNLSH